MTTARRAYISGIMTQCRARIGLLSMAPGAQKPFMALLIGRRELLAAGGACAGAVTQARLVRPRTIRLTLIGQALLEHDLRRQHWPAGAGIAALLGRADVVFTNLETVIVTPDAEVGAPTREALTLHSGGPEVLDCLKSLHINLLATANNHAFDLGSGGIRSTLAALDAAGLPHAGSGRDLAAAAAPALARGAPVALVAFATGKIRDGGAATPDRPGVNEVREDSPGVLNEADVARVAASVRAAAATSPLVVAYHHNHLWGDDMAVTPDWQRALARRLVDAGARCYVAHGAPLLHGLEFHRDAPLFYGLGNFIFQTETPPGRYPKRAWDGLIAECEFTVGRPVIMFRPIVLNELGVGGAEDHATVGRPALAAGQNAARILHDFADRSRAFGTALRIGNGRATLG